MKHLRHILSLGMLIALVASASAQSWLTNGLVAYYPFNGNASDASGNGQNATVAGPTQFWADRFGKPNGALRVNRGGEFVSGSVNLPDNPETAKDTVTYSLWFQPDADIINSSASDTFCVILNGGPDYHPLFFQITQLPGYAFGPPLRVYPWRLAGDSNVELTPDKWEHLCLVADGTHAVIYQNGVAKWQTDNYYNNSIHPVINLGNFSNVGYHSARGAFDDTRIYNRALSSNEVAQLYALEAPVPPTLTLQPQSLAAASGSVTNLIVGATGSDVIRYQWLKDGVALPGATNATLVFSNLQPVNVGDYAAVVSNGGGSVTSSVASVSIPGVNSGLWQGLVAYYPFNGNANDETGFGNDGNVTNVTFRSNRFFQTNSAADFASGNAFVECPTLSGMPYFPVTYSVWLKLNSFPPAPSWASGLTMTLIGRDLGGIPNGGAVVMYRNDAEGLTNEIIYYTGVNSLRTYQTPATNAWSHLVFTLDVSNVGTFFVDGKLARSETYPYLQNAVLPFRIGASADWIGNRLGWNGSISDVRIYNRALSSNDVAALYQLETAAPVFVTQPATVTHQIGDAVILSVQSAGGQPTTYTWHFSGAVVNSSTNSSLTIASVQAVHLGAYTVVASNQWGMATSSVATVYCPASIIAPPISVVSPLGGQALFLVEAAGYDLPTYQWMLNGTNLPNATASSLAVTNVQLRNAGSYAVVVSNSLGRVTSSVAWLSVSPSLYTPFVGATPIWGRSASIGVSAVGSGQLNFQWYLNGVAIDGATAPSINFPSIQFTNAGMYSVVISSAYGIVTNAAAEVSVNPAEVDLAFYPGLTINGHTGNRYTIQSSSDLSNTNNWITQTNLMLEMDTQLWFDSSVKASDPNNTQYFYRVLPEN